jgi:DNA-binding IclR family transcriptional regulator
MLTDRMVAQTGLGTALMGMVGLNVQLFRWMMGTKPIATSVPNGLSSGFQKPLCASAAGWLLLSTLPGRNREAMIRRMRAESGIENKFSVSEVVERVQVCGQQGYAIGPAGFGVSAEMCAVLLPREQDERPMALGFIYEPSGDIDPHALVALLKKSAQTCASPPANFVNLRANGSEAAISNAV